MIIKNAIKILFLVGLIFVKTNLTYTQNIPEKPNPPKLVNDFAGFLDLDKNTILNQQLEEIYQYTKNQISIVTLDNIGEYDLGDYANQLGRKWGIGDKANNSGLLILIVKQNRKIWIATGYGLEADLPDIVCQQIIRQIIKPNFKQGQFYEGLQNSVFKIVETLAKNDNGANAQTTEFYKRFLSGQRSETHHKKNEASGLQTIFIILFIIVGIIFSFRRKRFGGGGIFLGSGFGGGFGSSGGGNSDFGGGSFGGGGSGGSW